MIVHLKVNLLVNVEKNYVLRQPEILMKWGIIHFTGSVTIINFHGTS